MIVMERSTILCPLHGIPFFTIIKDGKRVDPVCEKCNNERFAYFLRNASKIRDTTDVSNP